MSEKAFPKTVERQCVLFYGEIVRPAGSFRILIGQKIVGLKNSRPNF